MIQYLIDLIDKIEAEKGHSMEMAGLDYELQTALIEEFSKELNRLDPRDFAPAVQSQFVVLRARIKARASSVITMYSSDVAPFKRLRKVLQFYGGPNSQVKSRSFKFVSDHELRKIVQRDYREPSLLVFSAGDGKAQSYWPEAS